METVHKSLFANADTLWEWIPKFKTVLCKLKLVFHERANYPEYRTKESKSVALSI